MATIKVRCGICRTFKSGEEKNDKLYSAWDKGYASAVRVANQWVCAEHKDKPLQVSVNQSVVTMDVPNQIRINIITKVRSNGGFNIGNTCYSVFGRVLRGYGSNVIRIATPDDIARYQNQETVEKERKRAQEEANQKRMNARNAALAKFTILLPGFAQGSVSVSDWDAATWEFQVRVPRHAL